jgi:hypothetical protein
MDEDLKQYLDGMEARMKAHATAESERTETKLLRAFHGWARTMEIRVRGASQAVAGFDERLGFAEERIGDLERGKRS